MWHRKQLKFVEVGKWCTGFCLNRKPSSSVQKWDVKKIIFWLWRHRDVRYPLITLILRRWSIVSSLMLVRREISEELRQTHRQNCALYINCQLQVVTIDRERLTSEKQNNKPSAEGARLPKEAMLLRDIYKFTKPFLDAFRPFGLISRACQGPRDLPIALTLTFRCFG